MAAVEVEGLTVRYGDVVAVDGIVLHRRRPGRITAVLGPNGAGKTTTVEVLEGFRRPDARPDAGARARPGRRPRAPSRAGSGVMLQSGGVGPGVRVGEALRHAAALYDHAARPGGAAATGSA